MSYQSPIDVIYGDMQTKLEGDVLKVIQNYDIKVDKDELLKALTYDRDQYHKGWSDGWVNAKWDIIRCKDCKHFAKWDKNVAPDTGYYCTRPNQQSCNLVPEDYCSYAERKDEVENG